MADGVIRLVGDEAALRIIVRQQRGEIDRIKQELVDAKRWAMQERSLRFAAESKPTLTDEEREAVECGIQAIGLAPRDERTLAYADTLRGLLERLK